MANNETIPEREEALVTQAEADAGLLHLMLHGDSDAWVQTEGGVVPTLANQAVMAQDKVIEVLKDVAAQLAVAAPYDTVAEGLAATPNNGAFTVRSADPDIYRSAYVNRNGVAEPDGEYPSAEAVSRIAGQGDFTDLEYAITDNVGRITLAIKGDGGTLVKEIVTASGSDLDRVAEGLNQVAGTRDFSDEFVFADGFGRIAIALQSDGRTRFKDAITTEGASLNETAAMAKQALDAASSGGASEFRRTLMEAHSRWGGFPRPHMATPPTLSLVSTADAPAGTTLFPWSSTGRWRTAGGFTSQYGANPYLQWQCKSPNGNAGGFTAAGGVSVETVHTGTALFARLRGAGGAIRVLVGDEHGKKLAYASKVALVPTADGGQWKLSIDFGAVSATRTIIIEGDGGLQFGGFWVKTGENIVAPAGVKPLVCCLGTSITENPNSWARWVGYLLGADVYNTGVGSSGVLNPGVSPRVKQMDRSNDFTAGHFLLGIDENGINDTGDALYSAATYAAIVREYGDEYRRLLDAWFTAHPNSPFIGWGPFWPNGAPVANAYRLRDAKQRVLSEYPLAAFIDTLEPMNIIQGSVSVGTYPAADYLLPGDTTHPIEAGHEFIGLTLFDHVNRLIRTVF